METKDKAMLARMMVAMGEMYDKEISPSLAEMYFRDLVNYDIAAIEAAMTAHRKDRDRGRWFPKVSDLIDKMESRNVTYQTSKHPALFAERERSRGLVEIVGVKQSVWQRMGFASFEDYCAGRRMH